MYYHPLNMFYYPHEYRIVESFTAKVKFLENLDLEHFYRKDLIEILRQRMYVWKKGENNLKAFKDDFGILYYFITFPTENTNYRFIPNFLYLKYLKKFNLDCIENFAQKFDGYKTYRQNRVIEEIKIEDIDRIYQSYAIDKLCNIDLLSTYLSDEDKKRFPSFYMCDVYGNQKKCFSFVNFRLNFAADHYPLISKFANENLFFKNKKIELPRSAAEYSDVLKYLNICKDVEFHSISEQMKTIIDQEAKEWDKIIPKLKLTKEEKEKLVEPMLKLLNSLKRIFLMPVLEKNKEIKLSLEKIKKK